METIATVGRRAHSGSATPIDASTPSSAEPSTVARPQHRVAGADVLAGAADVAARLDLDAHRHLAVRCGRVLDPHHGVGPFRHHGAGRDAERLAARPGSHQPGLPRATRRRAAASTGASALGAGRVRGADGVAVHRRVVPPGHVLGRDHVGGQDPPKRIVERHRAPPGAARRPRPRRPPEHRQLGASQPRTRAYPCELAHESDSRAVARATSATASLPLGAVLAGGAATRLGGAKATVELAGRPLIAYPLEALAQAGIDAVVVAKADSPLPPLEVEVVTEPDEPRHPLAGVVAALEHAGVPRSLVLPCDAPFVSPMLLRVLASATKHDRSPIRRPHPPPDRLLCARDLARLGDAIDGRRLRHRSPRIPRPRLDRGHRARDVQRQHARGPRARRGPPQAASIVTRVL